MNLRDMKDTIMEAEAEFQEIMQQLEMEYSQPDLKSMKLLWMAMPANVREQARKIDPTGYDRISKILEGA